MALLIFDIAVSIFSSWGDLPIRVFVICQSSGTSIVGRPSNFTLPHLASSASHTWAAPGRSSCLQHRSFAASEHTSISHVSAHVSIFSPLLFCPLSFVGAPLGLWSQSCDVLPNRASLRSARPFFSFFWLRILCGGTAELLHECSAVDVCHRQVWIGLLHHFKLSFSSVAFLRILEVYPAVFDRNCLWNPGWLGPPSCVP